MDKASARSNSARVSRSRRCDRNALGAAEQNIERRTAKRGSYLVTISSTDRFADGAVAGAGSK
jgi:hypothetical protein